MDLKCNAVNVKCPFYRTQGKKWIKCDGIAEGTAITQDFTSEVQKEYYQEEKCWDAYCDCPLAQLIEKRS